MSNIDTAASKKAYILARQLEAMHHTIEGTPDDTGSYSALAQSYNRFLSQSKELFFSDISFRDSISHLPEIPTQLTDDAFEDFGRLRASIPVLKAAVLCFFEFYSPQEEKHQIGFHPERTHEA